MQRKKIMMSDFFALFIKGKNSNDKANIDKKYA